MTFGTVPAETIWIRLGSMKLTPISLEENLLNASGLLAISLVALVSCRYHDLWLNLIIHSAFAAAFIVVSYDEELGLGSEHSWLAVLAMFALTIAALAANQDTMTLILSVVLMASAPYHLTARQSWLLMAVANLSYWLVFEMTWQSGDYRIAGLTLLALQGFAITSSLARKREMETQQVLARQNNELLAARAVMARQTQADERLRIAGDLHDTIGHRLTALRLQLEALSHESPQPLKPQVAKCQGLAAELLEDIRSIVRRMSEERRDDLADAVRRLEELTPGVEIAVTSSLPQLTLELTQQLVFCFQEAIHNAIRHGGATRVEIAYQDDAFHIRDNGRGLRGHRASPGFGLRNIDKRLAPFGGSVALSAAADDPGCELTLSLPASAGT
jgi:signal transduction histidine kinase